MSHGQYEEQKTNRWLMALVVAAGTTLAPAAYGQDEDPVSAMLRSLTDGIANQPARQAEPQPQLFSPTDGAELNGDITVDENMIVELHVQDESLANVLQMLSIQSQRNIVASKGVSATVTANLYGVTFYEALDAILHVNGYGYIERGNFIYVYTLEEMTTIAQASRQRVARSINLNFLNSIDAAEFVTPLLSDGGVIKTNGRTQVFSISGDSPTGADDYANSATLVVFDYPENIEEIQRLITELDTRPSQVLVEATIVQTTLNEANAFGVDFSIVGSLNIEDFINGGGPLGPVDGLLGGIGEGFADGGRREVPIPGDGRGRAIQSTPGNTSGPATMKLGLIQDDVSVFVRMLDEVSDTTILSNPKILALNRQASRVLVGRRVGFLSTTTTETSTTQSVEFLDTGTQLFFRPFVSKDGLIRMELKPQVSEAIIRNQTDATGAAVTIPDQITNEIVTNVLVPDGHTIVLGGLFREATTASRRQVPFLGDLPIIGAAFRGHEDDTQRTEIIFLIKPSIISDQVLITQGGRGEDYVRRVRAGSREGLLPWSRERQASQLLVEAEQLAANGKTDRALYAVRRALEHNPFQPDAIAMRERLMNEQAVWPHRNLLEDIVNDELFDANRGTGTMGRRSRDRSAQPSPAPHATHSRTQPSEVPPSNTVNNSNTVAPAGQFVPVPTVHNGKVSEPAPSQSQTAVSGQLQPTPMASQPAAVSGEFSSGSFSAQQSEVVITTIPQFEPISQPVSQTVTQPVSQPVSQPVVTSSVPADGIFRSVGTMAPVTQPSAASSSVQSNPFANLRPTPIAGGQTSAPATTSNSLVPTMTPIGASQTPITNAQTHQMQPTGAGLPPFAVQSMPAAAPSETASAAEVAASKPVASVSTQANAAVNDKNADLSKFATPWQRPEGFDLSDADVQMLLLTEFFRSFGTASTPRATYTEVPIDGGQQK